RFDTQVCWLDSQADRIFISLLAFCFISCQRVNKVILKRTVRIGFKVAAQITCGIAEPFKTSGKITFKINCYLAIAGKAVKDIFCDRRKRKSFFFCKVKSREEKRGKNINSNDNDHENAQVAQFIISLIYHFQPPLTVFVYRRKKLIKLKKQIRSLVSTTPARLDW